MPQFKKIIIISHSLEQKIKLWSLLSGFTKKKKKMAMSHLEPKELTLIGELNQIN